MLPHAPWVPMATWVMSFLYGSQKYEFELPYLASCWTGTSANSIFLREAPGFGLGLHELRVREQRAQLPRRRRHLTPPACRHRVKGHSLPVPGE